MPQNRFFLEHPFHLHDKPSLIGEEARHLARVMRKKRGEMVELVNGRNQLAIAEILSIQNNAIQLHIVSLEESPPSPFKMILCQAIPRPNRLDFILEKGTELGMDEIWLFPAHFSEKKTISAHQLKRLEAISIAAMKQCGRLDLPEIQIHPSLLEWKELPYPAYFGSLSAEAPSLLSLLEKKEGVCFFVGPESGFSDEEIDYFHKYNVMGVKLHPHTLRTDTASLVALALISQ